MTAATEDTFVDLLYRIPNSDRKELLALWTVLSEVGESRAACILASASLERCRTSKEQH